MKTINTTQYIELKEAKANGGACKGGPESAHHTTAGALGKTLGIARAIRITPPAHLHAVTVGVTARQVTVKGPRTTLTRSFRHAQVEFSEVDGGDKLRIDMWFATKKQLSVVNTIKSHIQNMMVGVYQVRSTRLRPPRRRG
eukprot:SAG11_NODE_3649_length_2313_cov_2.827010_2_plen_141_part_00